MLRLLLRPDYPQKTKAIEVKSSLTVEQLEKLASDVLELEGSYLLRAAAFGKDAIELDDSETTLEEAGVATGSTICLFAPESQKPERDDAKSQGGKRTEIKKVAKCINGHIMVMIRGPPTAFAYGNMMGNCDGGTGNGGCRQHLASNIDYYHCATCCMDSHVHCISLVEIEVEKERGAELDGLSAQRVLKELLKVKSGKRKQVLLKYVDSEFEEVVEHSVFKKLPRKVMQELLSRDTLGAEEVDVFQALVSWATAHLKTKQKTSTGADLLEFLGKDIQLVRFPLMDTSVLATQVLPSGILDNATTLALFTYAAIDPKPESKESTAKFGSFTFITKERSGAVGGIVNMCWEGKPQQQTYCHVSNRGYDFTMGKDRSVTGFAVRTCDAPGNNVTLYTNGNAQVDVTNKVVPFKHAQFKEEGWYHYSFAKPVKLKKDVRYTVLCKNVNKFYYHNGNNNMRACPEPHSDVQVESRYWSSNMSSKNSYSLDFLMLT